MDHAQLQCNTLLAYHEKPKHGSLFSANDKWFFKHGRGTSATITEIQEFYSTARKMIKDYVLFQGHQKFKDILHLRLVVQIKQVVAKHVSANGLETLIAPQSLSAHDSMSPSDKAIWYAAYSEELNGLENRRTWETITEDGFQRIRNKVKAVLPSMMAISTIKLDKDG